MNAFRQHFKTASAKKASLKILLDTLPVAYLQPRVNRE